jgi:hypothetical protein
MYNNNVNIVMKKQQSPNIKILKELQYLKNKNHDGVGGGNLLQRNNDKKRTEAGDLSICLAWTPIFLHYFLSLL